ncbi:ATP-binding protein [Halorhodospira halochloris]|uniref:ATP-binding protein n=1 Tax=Halorhodospira halochloris TaxID=1052 RepID=UPI001EE8F62E|nr:ATP-binding protein [Halorhodospira halochloris]MCG5530388.1 ATP-binding protein [Halorhodospira halochloris]
MINSPSPEDCERIASRMDGFLYRCRYDEELTMLFIIGAVQATTGYPRESLLNNCELSYAHLINPDDQAMCRGSRIRAIMDDSEWSIDYRIWHPQEGWSWVNERGAALLDDNGEVAYLEGAIVDISARKEAEQALARTTHALRERFKEVACLGEVAALTNKDISIDETLTAIVGLLPSGWQYPSRCEAIINYRGKRFATSRREPHETRLEAPIRASGENVGHITVWYVLPPPDANQPFLNEESVLLERTAIIIGQYLTRKHAEREREQLMRLIEASPDYIGMSNPKGMILYQNPALSKLTGFDTAADDLWLRDAHPDWAASKLYQEALPAAAQHGQWQGETEIFDGQGGTIPVSQTIVAHTDSRGDVEIFSTIMQNLSASREANRVKSNFLAAVSHDLRTPLNAIIGYSDLLCRSELDNKQREFVALTRRASDKLLLLIDMLLDLSRLEHGKLKLRREDFDIVDFVTSQVELVKPRAENKGVAVKQHIAPEIPRYVEGDAARVGQIVSNLLGNAVKFTDTGEVTIKLAQASPDWIHIQVSDNGPGIPEEERQRIFDWFSQGHMGTEQREGTGLGLKICLELVRLMGGSIDVDDNPAGGAIFTVIIPLPRAAGEDNRRSSQADSADNPATAQSRQVKPPESSTEELRRTDGGKLNLLVAEDEPTNALLLLRLLEQYGVQADLVNDGQQAYEKGSSGDYDGILMDAQMPLMSGEEAIAAIRSYESEHSKEPIPIIVISAHAIEEVKNSALDAGADQYITKPISFNALGNVLKRLAGVQAIQL